VAAAKVRRINSIQVPQQDNACGRQSGSHSSGCVGHHQTYELGEEVAQHDVDAFGLGLAARLTPADVICECGDEEHTTHHIIHS